MLKQLFQLSLILVLLFVLSGLTPVVGQTTQPADDGFENMDGGFESLEEGDFSQTFEEESPHPGNYRGLKFGIAALFFTILAGILVHFQKLRFLRHFFLLASLVILGFVNGGCPCSISSFQNVWLWFFGQDVKLHSLIWFLGLIPITYLFGRVWCGWACHLGAFQEFLYRFPPFNFLKGQGTQKTLSTLRIVLFVALIIQLWLTKTNEFVHYDPFKAVFNLTVSHTLTWGLLILLLLSSLLVYRPFCRGVCPVGLVLGWVTQIPGAFKLQPSANCTSCTACKRKCQSQAIDEELNFHSENCIVCGDCLDACKKEAIDCKWIKSNHPSNEANE